MGSFFNVLTSTVVLIPVAIVVLLFLVISLFVKNYIKVPTDKVAVFVGRGTPKVVRGGGRLRIPGLERVDYMSLQPFSVKIQTRNAISKDGVPVTVDAVGWVRIGSSDDAVRTAMERFPNMDSGILSRDLNNILEGSLRGIVATMTVEDLNSDREKLAGSVMAEAGSSLEKVGLEVDNLTIQDISDEVGYLEALGRRRTAEVKRDAEIGEAEAQRDSQIKSAAARQEGEIAQAKAETEIANAKRDLDVQKAKNQAQTQAETARADQAGPLAEAQAKKAVLVADEEANAAQTEARTRVEELRAIEQERRLAADVVKPAEAQKTAKVLEAEAEREAAIAMADGDAQAIRKTGEADAYRRKALADAERSELVAQADGKKADLLATAEGQAKLADALNRFTDVAVLVQLAPALLQAQVDSMKAAAEPLGNIDNVSVISGGNGSSGALGGIEDIVPNLLAKVLASSKAQGLDLAALLTEKLGGALSGASAASLEGTTTE